MPVISAFLIQEHNSLSLTGFEPTTSDKKSAGLSPGASELFSPVEPVFGIVASYFNQFLRPAELEEPVERAGGFRTALASYRSASASNPTGS
jgi:hypothetical protein